MTSEERLKLVLEYMDDPRFAHLPVVERHNAADFRRDITAVLGKLSVYRAALNSIAGNTCCDSCREAALVAAEALAE